MTIAPHLPATNGTAARGGSAIGAMFFSAFGGAWLALWGYSEFTPARVVLLLIAAAAGALLAASCLVYRRNAAALRADSETPEARRRSRLFNLINAGQWVVVFLLALLLSRLHRDELILPAIILVIGLHFFPLARLFAYPPHYLTGLALVVLALLYPVLSADGARSGIGALGAGLILWASAIVALLPGAVVAPSRANGD